MARDTDPSLQGQLEATGIATEHGVPTFAIPMVVAEDEGKKGIVPERPMKDSLEVYRLPHQDLVCYVGQLEDLPGNLQEIVTVFPLDIYELSGGIFEPGKKEEILRQQIIDEQERVRRGERNGDIHVLVMDTRRNIPLNYVRLVQTAGDPQAEFSIQNLPTGEYFNNIETGTTFDGVKNCQGYELSRLVSVAEVYKALKGALKVCTDSKEDIPLDLFSLFVKYLPKEDCPESNSYKSVEEWNSRRRGKNPRKGLTKFAPSLLLMTSIMRYANRLKKEFSVDNIYFFCSSVLGKGVGGYLSNAGVSINLLDWSGIDWDSPKVQALARWFRTNEDSINVFWIDSSAPTESFRFKFLCSANKIEIPTQI